MEYRVNEVGALIFKSKEDKEPTLKSVNEEVIKLKKEIESMKNQIAELREKGE